LNTYSPKSSGTPRPIKVVAMLLLPVLIGAVVACDNGTGSNGSSQPAATATSVPYAGVPEGKPPLLGAPVPDPQEVIDTEAAGQLPAFLSQAGVQKDKITALYKGAVDNYDAYSHIPCYCGCAIYMHAHMSLAQCYIKQENADGSMVFTDHSMSCDICQGVAQQTLNGIAAGTPLKDIRTAVYNKFKYTQIWTDTPPPSQ